MSASKRTATLAAVALVALLAGVAEVFADVRNPTTESVGGVNPQCPGDVDGDAIPDWQPGDPGYDPSVVCMHLTAGDGFANMADGHLQYIFGFHNVTGVPRDQVMQTGMLAASWPAPAIVVKEGQKLYLSLTNVGMAMRPDLFDPHTVHFHGFPQASALFDGLPESGVAINMGSTLTYFYSLVQPGTFMYHCHVEATEHMQMGMLGNLYVLAGQDDLPEQTFPNGWHHLTGMKYVYDDNDGSTYYDREYALQIAGFDAYFHDQHLAIQPLPFAELRDNRPMLNGRGYPDTVLEAPIANGWDGKLSQVEDSKIYAVRGERTLVRISSLDVVRAYTVSIDGIPMKVVGKDSRMLRSSATGANLPVLTSSVTLGGGSAVDIILDLAANDVPAGVYPLYTTNLNYLSNGDQDFGGMMTEVHVVDALP